MDFSNVAYLTHLNINARTYYMQEKAETYSPSLFLIASHSQPTLSFPTLGVWHLYFLKSPKTLRNSVVWNTWLSLLAMTASTISAVTFCLLFLASRMTPNSTGAFLLRKSPSGV